ncbi:hypothetical protein [Mucilaginibacter litoreus]|uniref:hypothetical protein n=1 Tax=Mucilaginibacter litoreus TaxID=1048221 RepID=UPI00366CB338
MTNPTPPSLNAALADCGWYRHSNTTAFHSKLARPQSFSLVRFFLRKKEMNIHWRRYNTTIPNEEPAEEIATLLTGMMRREYSL